MTIATTLRRHALDIAVLAALSVFSLYATARIGFAPRDPGAGVAVIFSPWTASDATLGKAVDAGARFIRFGGLPFIAVVIPDDAGYAARILGQGAWLVVDPRALAACFPILAPAETR